MIVTKPPMGWSSWNTFGPHINEEIIRGISDALVETGLRDAGYEYVVIDDCWSKVKREDGMIVPDPEKFPSGIKALADYVHSKGLKLGIYSCDGTHTCAGYPASFDNEWKDAQMFADWGVDFLKYDNCHKPSMMPTRLLYNRMAMALRATGRDMVFSACNWGTENVEDWAASVGAHMYRSTDDIADSYERMKELSLLRMHKYEPGSFNCFNDMDILINGMNGEGHVGVSASTPEQYALHFAIWCFFASPLMIGCDVRSIDTDTLALLKNPEFIRINQDAEARPPFLVHENDPLCWTFFRHMENGEYISAFFNLDDSYAQARFETYEIGITYDCPYTMEFTDIVTGEKFIENQYFNQWMPPHSFKLFRTRLIKK